MRRKDQGLGQTAAGGSSGSFSAHARAEASPPPATQVTDKYSAAQIAAFISAFQDETNEHYSPGELTAEETTPGTAEYERRFTAWVEREEENGAIPDPHKP